MAVLLMGKAIFGSDDRPENKERRRFKAVLDATLRVGMAEEEAARALADRGIPIESYTAGDVVDGRRTHVRLCYPGEERLTLFPFPAPRRTEVTVEFEGTKVARWDATLVDTIL